MKLQTHRFSSTLALVAPGAVLLASQAGGAFDAFLKIGDIKGEAVDPNHREQIEILSWSWGASNPTTTGGGGGAGKVVINDFTVVKKADKASPLLFLACATGEVVPECVLTMTRPAPDGSDVPYYTIKLTNVLVSSVQSSRPPLNQPGAGGGVPTESISLNFSKIEWEYRPMNPTTGELGDLVSSSATVETGTP